MSMANINITFVLIIAAFFSCNSDRGTSTAYTEHEYKSETQVGFTFGYVTALKPSLHYNKGIYLNSMNNIPPSYNVIWDTVYFTSQIIDVNDIRNEDEIYRHKDWVQSRVMSFAESGDLDYKRNVMMNVLDLNKRQELTNYKTRILNIEMFTFPSYAEASKKLSELRGESFQ